MDDATLLELEALKVEALAYNAQVQLGVLESDGLMIADGRDHLSSVLHRIRALKSPPTEAPKEESKSTGTDALTAQIIQAIDDAARLDCECGESHFVRDSRHFYCAHCGKRGGYVQRAQTATIDDPSDPVVPGSHHLWQQQVADKTNRAIQNRLAAARAIVNQGLVEVSIPGCVKDTGSFCGKSAVRDWVFEECPHGEVPEWLCLCGQAPGCGNPDCIGDKLWQALNGAYVVDLVGLLIKTLPELPPDLEEEVVAAVKAIGVAQ